MTKKLNRHSVHLSDELETVVKRRIKAGGYDSLNSYFESLVEREGQLSESGEADRELARLFRKAVLRVMTGK